MTKTATYHIYLEDRCIFKNLNEEEFDLIWDRYPDLHLAQIEED